jgi:hypothetical protein
MVNALASSSRQYELWMNSNQLLQCGRTYPALFPQTLDEILQQSSPRFENAGRVTSRGAFLTLSISESPKDAAACLLSQILEESVPPRYFLSQRAAAGILRRAEKRGRELPPSLHAALELVAQMTIRPKRDT